MPSRGGKSGNRPSGLMPPACCICFGGHGVPLDNDQRGSWPIGSCWSRGVCPPELQAFLHPANKPPALPTSKVSGAVLRSSGKRVIGPVSPSLSGNGQSRPVTEHRPPAWAQQVLQGDYWVQIPGTVHRQTSIQIRCRWNYPVPAPQMNNVLLPGNRAGAAMTPALNRRLWSTSHCFPPIRRWAGGLIRMLPVFGLRSSVVPEFPAGPLRGQCAVPGPAGRADSVAWEWIPEQGWPWVKRAPLLTLPPDLGHPGVGLKA